LDQPRVTLDLQKQDIKRSIGDNRSSKVAHARAGVAVSEQVIQEGLLDDVPLVDLVVAALCASGATRLELLHQGGSRAFTFADKKLTLVEATGDAQSLVTMLLKRKQLNASDSESLLNEAQTTGEHIIEVIARNASITHSTLARECGLWATLLLVQSMGWEAGKYRVLSVGRADPLAGIHLEVHVAAALIKGIYKRMDIGEIELMIRPYSDSLPTLVPSAPFSTSELDLDDAQLSFVNSIDGRRNIEEMLRFSALSSQDTQRMLYALHRLGCVSFEEESLDSDPASDSSVRHLQQSPEPDSSPVDFSSIRFNRGVTSGKRSATFHSASPHSKESVTSHGSGPIHVEVGLAPTSTATGSENPQAAPRETTLSGLFDDLDMELGPTQTPQRQPDFRAGSAADTHRSGDGSADQSDLPPSGAGPVISPEDWKRLSSKEKGRVRQLRSELDRLNGANYFGYFSVTHESPEAVLKKAYFKAAKRYHPDALLDDSDTYRQLAEALFAKFSEAWETLSDVELRDKYVRKHIHGEKDENDLAMEQVQRVLDAEGSFKNGLRLLNAGKMQDALRHFKRAHEDYTEEGEYLAYYSFTLFRATRSSDPARANEALEMLASAIELSPNAVKPYHLMGKAQLLQGDGAAAKRYLRKVLKANADDTEALRDYRRADALGKGRGGRSQGGNTRGKKAGGFFSRFSRKKGVAPPLRKSEEEVFLENLDLDQEL